jgi:hypothetical protein
MRLRSSEARTAPRSTSWAMPSSAFTESTSLRLGLGELSLRTGVEILALRAAAVLRLSPTRSWFERSLEFLGECHDDSSTYVAVPREEGLGLDRVGRLAPHRRLLGIEH